jgi:outer membrane protein
VTGLSRKAIGCVAFSLGLVATLGAQPETAVTTDYSKPVKPFPFFYRPYLPWKVPIPNLANSASVPLTVQDGKLQLSITRLAAAVVDNNLTVASARYNPATAQTDLMRARSGASPRGVDVAQIPSGVFAGAQGGSILSGGGGFGGPGGGSNAGGITGTATQVFVRPVGLFDPTLSLNFSLDHNNSPLNTLVVAGVPEVTTNTTAFSTSYVQAFPTGTSFTLNYGMQRQGSTQLHLLFDPAFTPGFTFSVAQQLLSGFGPAVNKALINVAQNEQKIERASFRLQAQTALASAANAYWDLVAARESVRVAQAALTAAQQLEANNRRQSEVGTMASLDVVTAQSQVATTQRDLIVAQTAERNAELLLKTMFSKTLDDDFASATIETSDSFPEPGDGVPQLEQAVATAYQNRPEVEIAEGNIKSQKDALPFIRNALLPSVNIFAQVSTVGLYNVFGTAFVDALQLKHPQIAFGLTVSFPVRNRRAQADEVRSTMEMRQSEDTLTRTRRQISVDVQNALIALTQSQAQVVAARENVQLEHQKLDAEQTKLTSGISTSYNVVLVQRDLATAELAEVQALNAYAKARVTLDQAMGLTLDRYHITLGDALLAQARP